MMSVLDPNASDISAIAHWLLQKTAFTRFPFLDEVTFVPQSQKPDALPQKILIGHRDGKRVCAYYYRDVKNLHLRYFLEEDANAWNIIDKIHMTEMNTVTLTGPFQCMLENEKESEHVHKYFSAFVRACFVMKGLTAGSPVEAGPSFLQNLGVALNRIKNKKAGSNNGRDPTLNESETLDNQVDKAQHPPLSNGIDANVPQSPHKGSYSADNSAPSPTTIRAAAGKDTTHRSHQENPIESHVPSFGSNTHVMFGGAELNSRSQLHKGLSSTCAKPFGPGSRLNESTNTVVSSMKTATGTVGLKGNQPLDSHPSPSQKVKASTQEVKASLPGESKRIRERLIASYLHQVQRQKNAEAAMAISKEQEQELEKGIQHLEKKLQEFQQQLKEKKNKSQSNKRKMEEIEGEIKTNEANMKKFKSHMTGEEGYELAMRMMRERDRM